MVGILDTSLSNIFFNILYLTIAINVYIIGRSIVFLQMSVKQNNNVVEQLLWKTIGRCKIVFF